MSSFLGLENLQARKASDVSEEAYLDSYIKFEESASACGEALEVGKQLFDTAIKVVEINKVARKYGQSKSLEALVGCEFLNNRVSMEGDDADRTLWQKIKDWFVDMWHKIQDFFMSFSMLAKRAKAKLQQIVSNFSGGGGKYFNAEKLENTDKKCFNVTELNTITNNFTVYSSAADNIAKLISQSSGSDTGTVTIAKLGEKSTQYDPSNTESKGTYDLSDLKSTDILQLAKVHILAIDAIIKAKEIIPKAFKSAADMIKKDQEGEDRGKSLHIARMQAHNLMKFTHNSSKAVVRSANAFIWACNVAYKAGKKD